ncbi:BamA/TamA family outer membrane protein [Enterobacter asburiae]|uniref:BamA/TamA family outer membrane protein n=1 Tax=Scandinavium sp. UTDF21-P1B TaxID=3446379 RepID=UPI00349B0C94
MRENVWLLAALSGVLALPCQARSWLPDRGQIDDLLRPLGASTTFDPAGGIDWGIVPGPFYTPELGPGIGAAVVGMYRPDPQDCISQNSTLTMSGYISAPGAFGINFTNYAFFADDRWRFFLDGAIGNTPTWFWGQGFRAGDRDGDKQKYTSQRAMLNPMIYRQLSRHVYAGLGWSLDAQHAANVDSNDPRQIEGTPTGTSSFISGISMALSWDSRDFVPNPRSGQSMDLRYTRYTPATGSDVRFDDYKAHYSHYYSIGSKDVLAWEIDGHFTQGNVPWNNLPLLGNSQRMRGYYEGRYRDKNTFSGQLELRHKLSWRHGVVGWIGGGTMAPTFHGLNNGRWLPTAGAGYRFEFKPRMNVRLDYGIGKGSSGFYFQAGEAF